MSSGQQNAFEGQTENKMQDIIKKSKDLQVVMEALGQYSDDLENQTVDLESPERSNEDLSDSTFDKDNETEKAEKGQSSSEGSKAILGKFYFLINSQLGQDHHHFNNRFISLVIRPDCYFRVCMVRNINTCHHTTVNNAMTN